MRHYLGDAVWCEVEADGVQLYLSNGKSDHNFIFMEWEVYEAFIARVEAVILAKPATLDIFGYADAAK